MYPIHWQSCWIPEVVITVCMVTPHHRPITKVQNSSVFNAMLHCANHPKVIGSFIYMASLNPSAKKTKKKERKKKKEIDSQVHMCAHNDLKT